MSRFPCKGDRSAAHRRRGGLSCDRRRDRRQERRAATPIISAATNPKTQGSAARRLPRPDAARSRTWSDDKEDKNGDQKRDKTRCTETQRRTLKRQSTVSQGRNDVLQTGDQHDEPEKGGKAHASNELPAQIESFSLPAARKMNQSAPTRSAAPASRPSAARTERSGAREINLSTIPRRPESWLNSEQKTKSRSLRTPTTRKTRRQPSLRLARGLSRSQE